MLRWGVSCRARIAGLRCLVKAISRHRYWPQNHAKAVLYKGKLQHRTLFVLQHTDTTLISLPIMPLLVEFKPPTMYANAPTTRDEIIELAREHHRTSLLGKDGRIYDKAVVMCVSEHPDCDPVATSTQVVIAVTLKNTALSNIMQGLSSRHNTFIETSHSIERHQMRQETMHKHEGQLFVVSQGQYCEDYVLVSSLPHPYSPPLHCRLYLLPTTQSSRHRL
jgi:hypothetical protein